MIFEEHSLINLHKGLINIGLDALMLEGYSRVGWVPKKLPNYVMSAQPWNIPMHLGTIEIKNSPIRCVHLIREWREPAFYHQFIDKRQYEVCYRNIYMVLDSDLYNTNIYREIGSLRVKGGLLPNNVVNIEWKSDLEDKLLKSLNEDTLLNLDLGGLKEDITICSFPELLQWEISSSQVSTRKKPLGISVDTTPSRLQWDCYERIAHYLSKTTY